MVDFYSALQIAKAAEGAGYTAPSGLTFHAINPWCESGYFLYSLKIFLLRAAATFFQFFRL